MIERGDRVQVKKVAIADNPSWRTASWEEYKPGEDNGDLSLPVDYTIEGYVHAAPEVGSVFLVMRTHRNGRQVGGIFQTSHVQEIVESVGCYALRTRNSVYLVSKPISDFQY